MCNACIRSAGRQPTINLQVVSVGPPAVPTIAREWALGSADVSGLSASYCWRTYVCAMPLHIY